METPNSPLVNDRDGTSQEQRSLPALQTDFVDIDERNLKDQLILAYNFAKELKYFDLKNVAMGDWQGLINPRDLTGQAFFDWLEQIETFVQQPENFNDGRFPDLHRPHFILFLVFLQLLKNTQVQLNQLTTRHLEFYFREVLRFTPKPQQPDRVNLLVNLASQEKCVLLPAGTLLEAGKDSLGKELVYRTDNDFVVNQAKIARLSSVYVNQQIIDIRNTRELTGGTDKVKVMAMLKMAFGNPPGGDIPPYPPNKAVDFSLLTELHDLVKFVGSGLYMELGELRNLIQLKVSVESTTADKDWAVINHILTESGKARTGSSSFALKNSNPSDRRFYDNLKDALGVVSLTDYFNTLSLVKNIDQLYGQLNSKEVINIDELNDFIKEKLYMDTENFKKLMGIKWGIDKEWQDINRLLEKAGRRKSKDNQLSISEQHDFNATFQSALGKLDYPKLAGIPIADNLDGFYKALLEIETYFFMPLEDFSLLMDSTAAAPNTPIDPALPGGKPDLWPKINEKLMAAHQKKASLARLAQLNGLRPGNATIDAQKTAVKAMLQMALGINETDISNLVGRVKEFLTAGTNLSLLQAADNTLLKKEDWDTVCTQLELAWRNRVTIPSPQIANWLSLKAFSDTVSVKAPASGNSSRWYTFGQRLPQHFRVEKKPPSLPVLGWAISSPLLCLSQGKRKLTLTLGFKPETFDSRKIKELVDRKALPFLISLNTAKGWLMFDSTAQTMGDYPDSKTLKCLTWTVTIDESAPEISVIPQADSNDVKASWPVLRLLLQPRWDADSRSYAVDYAMFGSLLLEKVRLDVDVTGITDCKLQNDEQQFPHGKPFEPFGFAPAIGSRLYFIHPELHLKRLGKLEVKLPWMGIPNDDLGKYYKNYPAPDSDPATKPDPDAIDNQNPNAEVGIKTSSFKTKVSLVDEKLELPLKENAGLFADKATEPSVLTIENVSETIRSTSPHHSYFRQLTLNTDEDVRAWPQYFFLELCGCDFQHAAYPSVAATKAIQLAADMAAKTTITTKAYLVNPPYTPKLKNFSVNYTASIELDANDFQSQGADQVCHLHPFGYAPLFFDPDANGHRFLPSYENEGELYIGLSGVEAPQTLSLLLQMAEGTANPDLEPATVKWSVLNGNRWQNLDQGQLQQDGTNGLLQSGIIKLQLDAVAPSTVLPPDIYWLRIAVERGCDSLCDTIGIDTQVVSATFFDQDNADDHLEQPLPADTIKTLLEPIAGIESVKQPYTSFGGKPNEEVSRFNFRISERLRHKQRAVNHWDYERLVLEQFPDIYKAKCIPACAPEALGEVVVVVIPDIRNRLPFNPFEPKAQTGMLADIEAYLSAYAPLGASIKVKNPTYYPVRLRFDVQFQPGCDGGFYKQQLNEDINRFLSPWAYEQGEDIVIGGKIYATAIIDYIERLPYVDYVAKFTLFIFNENENQWRQVEKPKLDENAGGYAVTANRPDAVLVAWQDHDIDLVNEINFAEQILNKGINYMKIELDFTVG